MKTTTLANSILNFCLTRKIDIDTKRLHDMLYIQHGWYMAITDDIRLHSEFRADLDGPVCVDLEELNVPRDHTIISSFFETTPLVPPSSDTEFWEINNLILNTFIARSEKEIDSIIKKPGGAWDSTLELGLPFIPDNYIRLDFLKSVIKPDASLLLPNP